MITLIDIKIIVGVSSDISVLNMLYSKFNVANY